MLDSEFQILSTPHVTQLSHSADDRSFSEESQTSRR